MSVRREGRRNKGPTSSERRDGEKGEKKEIDTGGQETRERNEERIVKTERF